MGVTESHPSPDSAPAQVSSISISPEIDRQRASDDFLFSLVERVEPFLEPGSVFRWNKNAVRDIVLGISDLDPEQHWDFRAARGSVYSLDEETRAKLVLPIGVARRLLKFDPRLARLRFRLVPARIKEADFWAQYYEQIVCRVLEHVKQCAEIEEEHETGQSEEEEHGKSVEKKLGATDDKNEPQKDDKEEHFDALSVVVSNLGWEVREANLVDFFASCGDVVSVNIPPASAASGVSHGVAIVVFDSPDAVQAALGRSGQELLGRAVQVAQGGMDMVAGGHVDEVAELSVL